MKLPLPTLMVVTDPTVDGLGNVLLMAIQNGATCIQYRDKTATTPERIAWIRRFRELWPDYPVLVNGDVEAALKTSAHGVHLPSRGMRASEVRDILGPEAIIGRSVHWDDLATGALGEKGLDYVVFGTVFSSESHPGGPVAGLRGLRHACVAAESRPTPLPVLAIGGITPANAAMCMAAGAAGVAVIRSVLNAPDPGLATSELVKAIGGEP